MPTRILRDWTDSEPVNQISAQGERTFARIIMKADDYGRLVASPKLLRPLLYPLLLDQVREADLQRWIAECVRAGLVRLYSVEGKQYLVVVKFKQRIRAEASKYPDPPPHDDGQVSGIRQADVGPPRTKAESESKANNTIPQKAGARQAFEEGFSRFWASYPRKKAKGDAEKAWRKLNPTQELVDGILMALEAAKGAVDWQKDGGRFIPYPATWLNGKRWEDEFPDDGGERRPQAKDAMREALGDT